MAGEDFTFEIKADPSSAASAAANVEKGLDRVTAAAGRTGQAIDKAFSGQLRDAQGRFLATGNAASQAGSAMGSALDGAAGKAKGASQAVGEVHAGMMDLVAIGVGYVGGHELMELADGYTNVANKIRVVTDGQANFNGIMDETFSIAQETRTDWEQVTGVFQRLTQVTEGLGLSQKDVIAFTRELGMATRVAGATTREASMAMGEITHAFETGSLQSREYKVLMRDVPALMHELQKASGLTGAEFADMGKNGKITAEKLIEWFAKAGPDIEEKFGKVVPTITDSVQILHNAASKFFGEAGTGSGVLSALSEAAKFVADHFEVFGKVLLGVGEALVGLYVLDKVIAMVRALTVAIAANPIGAMLVAVTTAVMLLRQFGDVLDIDSRGVAKVSDVLAVLWGYVKDLTHAVVVFLDTAWSRLTGAFSDGLDSKGIEVSLENVLLFMASWVDAGIGLFKFFGDSIVTVFGGIPVFLGDAFINLAHEIAHVFEALINGIITGINALGRAVNKVSDVVIGGLNVKAMGDAAAMPAGPDRDAAMKAATQSQGPHVGQLGKVDFDFKNPLEGSADAFVSKFKDDWQKDVKEEDFAKNLVEKFMADVNKHAEARIIGADMPRLGTVDDKHHDKDKVGPTKEQIAALKKLEEQLQKVLEQSNPVTDAQMRLANAEDVLTRATKANLIGVGDAAAAYAAYAAKLEDALHPHEAWVRKQIEASAALRVEKIEQEDAAKVLAYENDMKQKGVVVTDVQLRQATQLIATLRERDALVRNQQAQLEAIRAPQKAYDDAQRALNELLVAGKVGAEQYERAIEGVRDAYAAATPYGKTFAYGLESGLRAIRDEVNDVASAIKTTLVNAFHGVENAVVDLVMKGKIDFKAMVDSMLADMTRLILRQGEQALMKLIFDQGSAAAAGATTGGSAAAVMMAAAPGIGAVIGGTAAAMIAAASAVGGIGGGGGIGGLAGIGSSMLAGQGLGFATGGSFVVGGNGGTDTSLVAFRATPGEKVTIQTPGQQNSGGGGGSGGQAPVVHVHNHHDNERDLIAVVSSGKLDTHIVNVIRRNNGAVRTAVSKP